MKQHLKRHLGMKNYMCDHCSRGFVTKGDLNKHMRKHTGAYPYHCELCGKKFNDISAYYRHTNNMHNNVPQYRCKICQLTFSKLDVGQGHLIDCHSNLIDTEDIEKTTELWLEDLLLQGTREVTPDYSNTVIVTINEPSTI